MTLSEAIQGINDALRATDDDVPTSGDSEWLYWTRVLNRKKDELFRDVSKNWSESYEVRSLGTITASAAPSYNLPADFLAPSGDDEYEGGGAYITRLGGSRVNLPLIKPEERNSSVRGVFIAGRNPEKLYFTDAIVATENIFGGTLYLPGYFLPADLVEDDDVLPFPDPNWGVLSAAAELAFNDIIYEDRAEGLNARANNLYRMMVNANSRGIHGNPRTTPRPVTSIRSIGR